MTAITRTAGASPAASGQDDVPKAPRGLKTAGRRLWRDVQCRYVLEEHETALLTELCRVTDRLDALARTIDADGVMEPGTGRVHPALVESRQLAITLARLQAAMRLPAGDDADHQAGARSARRPQRRAFRGVYLKAVR